jgi:hypothetical protein
MAARWVRMLILCVALACALIWAWKTNLRPERTTLLVTAVIGALTAVYALFTYEILLQNQTMAEAALESARLTERSLRFSHSGNLTFATRSTRGVQIEAELIGVSAVKNKDYERAVAMAAEGGDQTEFVYAIIENKGKGTATNVSVEAEYRIVDSSNPNGESVLTKHAAIPLVEPSYGFALCIFMARTPTPNDSVILIRAKITSSDFYREAISEPVLTIAILPETHHTDQASSGVIRLA